MQINKLVVALMFGSALALSSVPAFGRQHSDNSAKQDIQKAGHATADAAKTAGKDIKKGTEKAYHATKKGTEKTYDVSKKNTKKASHATARGTEKVWDKTKGAVHGSEKGSKESDDSKKP